jgi:hypothetical protein
METATATGDFERLVSMADDLVHEHDDASSPEWEMSPISWIRQVSSAHRRGKIGEEIVRAWALSEGLYVGGRGTRGHDCLIAGLKIEVKTSLRWNNDRFVFLGLRDFDYDAVALLGLEPNDFGLWIVPKPLLWKRAKAQLRGVGGKGSKWVSFPVAAPPTWLKPWGGSFAQALTAIREVPGYPGASRRAIRRRGLARAFSTNPMALANRRQRRNRQHFTGARLITAGDVRSAGGVRGARSCANRWLAGHPTTA